MTKACILIKTEVGKHSAVAREARKIQSVRTCFPVIGRTDAVAIVDARTIKQISKIALRIGSVSGVSATETLLSLEV